MDHEDPYAVGGLHPLTADKEDAIWSSAFRVRGASAPPMSGWLLHAGSIWSDKRALAKQMFEVFGVSSKTWEAGLPKRPRKIQQVVGRVDSRIRQRHSELESECAERMARALARDARSLTDHPALPPCTVFHHSFGIAGGDRLEALAVALDRLSEAVRHDRMLRADLPEAITKVAEATAAVSKQTLRARPDLDPGLDSLLLLMAQMDHDLTAPLMANDGQINSLFALLIDAPVQSKQKRVQRRLLDIYYGLAVAAAGREPPDCLPNVDEVENALLGGPPDSGGQSWIVRWRNDAKALREEHISSMIEHIRRTTGKDLSWTMVRLYVAARVWGRLEKLGSNAVGVAGERYVQWWSALCNQGRSRSPWLQPYWAQLAAVT